MRIPGQTFAKNYVKTYESLSSYHDNSQHISYITILYLDALSMVPTYRLGTMLFTFTECLSHMACFGWYNDATTRRHTRRSEGIWNIYGESLLNSFTKFLIVWRWVFWNLTLETWYEERGRIITERKLLSGDKHYILAQVFPRLYVAYQVWEISTF